MVNMIFVRGTPMSGVISVSSGDVISLDINDSPVKIYTASADGQFHINGYFRYEVDEDDLTDPQRIALINQLGNKFQAVSKT